MTHIYEQNGKLYAAKGTWLCFGFPATAKDLAEAGWSDRGHYPSCDGMEHEEHEKKYQLLQQNFRGLCEAYVRLSKAFLLLLEHYAKQGVGLPVNLQRVRNEAVEIRSWAKNQLLIKPRP